MNRRSFVTGLSFACSLAMVRGALASVEHKSALEERVRAQLDLGASGGLTVGAVIRVVQHGKVLALEAAGFSNAETRTAIRTDAIFDIRSISKTVTAFGVCLLVDAGKFALDYPLAKFLPGVFPSKGQRADAACQRPPGAFPAQCRKCATATGESRALSAHSTTRWPRM